MARAGGSRPAGGRTGGTHSTSRPGGGSRPSPRTGGIHSPGTSRPSPRTGGVHSPGTSRPSPRTGGMGGLGMPPPPPRRPLRRHPGPGMPPPPPMGGYRHRRRGSCLAPVLAVFILIATVIIAASLPYKATTDHHSQETTAQHHVTPLPSSAVHETGYYTDELGWVRNASALENSLKKFYSATGVQPYVYLSKTALSQSEADSLYSRLFTDEGHFLLAITDDWNTAYILGDDAAGVLTGQVMDFFWENFDDCADSARSDEDVLVDAFAYTADGLSSDTREPAAMTEGEHRTAYFFLILAIVLFLVVAAVIITVIVRSRKNARYDRAADAGQVSGNSQSQGYNLNGEFHTYGEKQDL